MRLAAAASGPWAAAGSLALAAALWAAAGPADGTRRPALDAARAEVLWDEALVARREGRPKKVLAAVGALLRSSPLDPRSLSLEAEALGQAGDARGEAGIWELYMRVASTPTEACPGLGRAYEKLGDLSAALDAHRRCWALDPTKSDLRLHYARALEAAARPQEAEPLYAAILAESPGYSDAALFLGRMKLNRGDLAGAEALIGPVASAPGAGPDALLFGALLDDKQGRADRAVARLRTAIAAAPGYADLYRVLIRVTQGPSREPLRRAAEGALSDLDAGRPPRALPKEPSS